VQICKPRRVFRILIVEDNKMRAGKLLSWLPQSVMAVVAASAGRAIGILQRDRGSVYAGIMLDHDLQENVVTCDEMDLSGKNVVDVIIKNISKDVPIFVHSMNINQAPAMVERLEKAGFEVTRIPFAHLTQAKLNNWIEEVREIWDGK